MKDSNGIPIAVGDWRAEPIDREPHISICRWCGQEYETYQWFGGCAKIECDLQEKQYRHYILLAEKLESDAETYRKRAGFMTLPSEHQEAIRKIGMEP